MQKYRQSQLDHRHHQVDTQATEQATSQRTMDSAGGGQPPDHPMGGPDPPDSGGRKSPARFTAQQKGKQRADRSIRDKFTEDEARALSAFPPPPPEGGITEPHAAWVVHPGYRCVMCTNPSCEICPAYGQHRMQGYMDGSLPMASNPY